MTTLWDHHGTIGEGEGKNIWLGLDFADRAMKMTVRYSLEQGLRYIDVYITVKTFLRGAANISP